MSLLSIDISKVKRLSLREVKLPAPERRVDPITPIQVERPPTDEEIAYSRVVAINPVIEDLVERLDLVSIKTGERIRKVELQQPNNKQNERRKEATDATTQPESGKEINSDAEDSGGSKEKKGHNTTPTDRRTIHLKLIALAQRAIDGEKAYSKEEIIARIIEAINISQERAEIGFNLMLKAGAIEQTINPELYYLGGSTPF